MIEPVSFYSELAAAESRTAARAAQRENGARNATSYHQRQTEGTGQVRTGTPLMFDVVFLTEPVFTAGASVVTQPSPDRYTAPRATAQVTQWLRNERGHYLGASLVFEITTPVPREEAVAATDPVRGAREDAQVVRIVHHLSFNALAYKPLGDDVMADLQSIAPRVAGGFW